ncbi:MAG: MFS transporter, partial [bacterium]|nr:MFS transporter [bacterium]
VAVVVVLVALAGVVASFGGHRKAPSGKPRSFPWAGPLNSLKNLFDLKRDPQLLLAISGSTFFYFISLLAVLVIKTLGLKQLGFSFTETSLLSGSLMVGVGIGSLIAGKMVSIERWTRFLVPSAAGMGLGLILAGMVPAFPREIQLWSLFVFFTLTGACGGMFLIPIASFIQVRPAPDEKGKIIGVSNFASFGFMMVSGVLFTWLDPLWSPGTIMSALGAFTVLAAGLLALFLFGGKLLDWTLAFTTRRLLALRYRIEVSGLETIRKKGTEGILFLPNHPALIDPLIVTSQLFTDFRPRPMADRDQSDRPLIKQVLRRLRAIIIPDLTKVGQQGSEAIQEALGEVIDGLKQKDTILLYPSGRIYRSCLEEIGGNSAVEQIVKNVPDCRVVLVRTRGLWGSTFGHAGGHAPKVGRNILLYLASAVWNLVFFIPRRQVTIEFIEPEDFPRTADRLTINGYLETFYNEDALPNTFVPYIWWQGYRPQIRPEPARKTIEGDASRVPETTRKLVIDFLTETTGVSGIEDDHSLSRDLGMDSLTLLELMSWMGQEFGLPQEDLEALQTVGDCLLAACGEMVGRKMAELKPVPAAWFKDPSDQRLSLPEGKNIGEVFLAAARRSPGAMLAADQMSGALTYRRLVAGVMALKKAFDVLPGDTLGIMLPASVSATMTYLAVMFSGKTPVMVNWTVGEGHMAYCLRQTGVTRVITARLLLERLKGRGFDPGKVDVEWVFLEDIVRGISWVQKLVLLVKSYCSWQSLARVKLSKTACVLFTSGSEANPKAVPLTHANILVNIRDFISVLTFKADDRLLGMLPPFHSLGLTGTVIMPCVIGLRIVYHSDPTAAVALARLIELYKSTQ